MMYDESFAGCDLLGALVDGADISHHVGLDGILGGLGVSAVDNNPWNVSVSWDEFFSGNCHFDLVVNADLGGCACANCIPVKRKLACTFLALGSPITGAGLEADDEGKGLSILVIESQGASFNEVALAFPWSMLAGESPAGAVLHSSGITVGVKVEITNLPEVLSVCCGLECTHDILLAVRAEGLEIVINLDTIIVGLDSHHVVSKGN